MYRIAAIATLASLLSGCSTVPEPASTRCPMPPPSLLMVEGPLDRDQTLRAPLSQRQAIEAWLTDIGRYEALRERHAGLSQWVLVHCLKATEARR
jgi:hypothetical protein